MIKPNKARLHAILKQIVCNPKSWVQRAYRTKTDCGTAYCFAGHAVCQAKPKFRFTGTNKNSLDAWIIARQYLGLTEGQAQKLFACDNTLSDLVNAVEGILGGDTFEELLEYDDLPDEDGIDGMGLDRSNRVRRKPTV